MRTSLRDVAGLAGVSTVTVSNVLRGIDSRASVETRERVLAAVRELNYIPVAQPTVQRRRTATRVIGVLLDCLEFEDPWGMPTYRGLREGAERHGYDLLTLRRDPPRRAAEPPETRFLDHRCDAFVFLSPHRPPMLEALVRHGVPAVTCFTDDVPEGVAAIMIDNELAMRQSVDYLVAQGHRRIAYLGDDAVRRDFEQRLAGYAAAMVEHGLDGLSHRAIGGPASMPRAAAEALAMGQRGDITAIACANDGFALEFHHQATSAGLRIPDDLSIVGLDDLPEAREYGLTTFHVCYDEVGRRAMDAVVALINGESAQSASRAVSVRLVERSSVGPI